MNTGRVNAHTAVYALIYAYMHTPHMHMHMHTEPKNDNTSPKFSV